MADMIQIIFLLGLTNLLFLILVALSCRCMGIHKLTNKLFKYPLFQRFYSYHCYYWYGFFISVFLHTVLAFYLFGWPF